MNTFFYLDRAGSISDAFLLPSNITISESEVLRYYPHTPNIIYYTKTVSNDCNIFRLSQEKNSKKYLSVGQAITTTIATNSKTFQLAQQHKSSSYITDTTIINIFKQEYNLHYVDIDLYQNLYKIPINLISPEKYESIWNKIDKNIYMNLPHPSHFYCFWPLIK